MAATRVTHSDLISGASKTCPRALRVFENLSVKNEIKPLTVRRSGEQDAVRDMIHIAWYDSTNGSRVYAGLQDSDGIQLYRQKPGDSFVEPIGMDTCFPEGHAHVKAFVAPFDTATSLAGKPPTESAKSVVVRELRRYRLTISVVYHFLLSSHVRDVTFTDNSIEQVQKDFEEVCLLVQKQEASKAVKQAANDEAVEESNRAQATMQHLLGSSLHHNKGYHSGTRGQGVKRKTSSADQIDDYEPDSEEGPMRKRGPSDRYVAPARSGLRAKFDKMDDGSEGPNDTTADNVQVAIPIRPSPGPLGSENSKAPFASSSKSPKASKGKERQTDPDDDGFYSSMNKQIEERIQQEVDNRLFLQDQEIRDVKKEAAAWKAKYELLKKKLDVLREDD
ncbi:hypothetical protein E8E13_000704 [Curvularia kusanoi]|uniref:Uncharacterized protein n=1 Tax=Curvularia kusanoi TaxID=90978 RepID=A0A9P4WBT1_CURKU|nr:hypothetical protein E8E13_000704 [Curvularia kusanoi]